MGRKRGYLNKHDLLEEIVKSKEQDELTPKAVEFLMLLAKRTIRKLPYYNDADRDDCLSSAYFDLFKYWRGFNPEKSDNAFAYFTSIIFRGAAKGWNELNPKKYKGTISLDSNSDSDGIYSL